jgi:hypothetical protein
VTAGPSAAGLPPTSVTPTPSTSPAEDPAPEPPIAIAVLGSCVTRDNFNTRFNPGYKAWYRTVLMQNQSSLISVMSEPTPITPEEIGEGTDYDKWNVRTDLSKEFLDELGRLAPDYLILDFFGDVHFGVLQLPNGSYVTNNRWKLWPTPFYKALKEAGPLRTLRIDRDTETYLPLWRDAFDRLVRHVKAVAPDTTVIVHKGRNTPWLTLPDSAPVSLQENRRLSPIDLPRLNELWSVLNDYAVSSTGYASIDLWQREYPSFDAHPWGPYYVHYAMDYYADFLSALNTIHLGRVLERGTPPLRDMLEQVVSRLHDQRAPGMPLATPAQVGDRAAATEGPRAAVRPATGDAHEGSLAAARRQAARAWRFARRVRRGVARRVGARLGRA